MTTLPASPKMRSRSASGELIEENDASHVGTAFVIALLWAPGILVPVVVQLMQCDMCWAEPAAAFVCQLLLVPFVVLPVVGVLAYLLVPKIVPRTIAELLVIWFVWNSHIIGLFGWLLPFLIASYHTAHSYSEVLYDFGVFLFFVPAPLVMCSGGLKLVSNKRNWWWGWRQRAVIGSYCIIVTISMWAGQYYVRPHAVSVTVVTSLLFYAYAVCTMLPPPGHPLLPAPEVSGAREWATFREVFFRPVFALATSYLRIKVIDDKGELGADAPQVAFEPGRATIAGFHPHGVIPYTCGLMFLSSGWRERYSVLPHFLTDFFTHLLPLMRDINQWVGGREVSRDAISKILNEKGTLLLVPGGQQEIFTTRSWGTEVYIYKGHRGFVREALKHKARLVPILSMGEWELMDNVHWPKTQRITRSFLGCPLPFVPHGAYYLPMPNRPKHGLNVIVGQPIDYVCENAAVLQEEPPLCVPSEADVDRAHALYFDAIQSMFERYKERCGYPEHTLVLVDRAERPPPQPAHGGKQD